MATNKYPMYTTTPNVGFVAIATTNAQVKSDGTSAGSGADLMYKVFTAGANGSYLEKVRFMSVANAATTGVATVLRIYLSTVSSPGATATTDTICLAEISAPAVPSANSVNAANPLEYYLNMVLTSGQYIHVSQHVAQTTNQRWAALAIGGDY